jgi:hypothetical protein
VHIKGLLVKIIDRLPQWLGGNVIIKEQRAKIRKNNNVGPIAHIIFMNFGDLTCCCLINYNESRGG